MKKFLIFLIPTLILITSGYVSAGECSPESSDYDHCWYYSYGTATAYIQISDPYDADGYKNPSGGYYLQYAKINAKCFPSYGGKLYKYRGLNSWSDVSCNEYGCNHSPYQNDIIS